MKTLTITYRLRDLDDDDWLFDVIRDGDYNGVLEWVMNKNPSVDHVDLR